MSVCLYFPSKSPTSLSPACVTLLNPDRYSPLVIIDPTYRTWSGDEVGKEGEVWGGRRGGRRGGGGGGDGHSWH